MATNSERLAMKSYLEGIAEELDRLGIPEHMAVYQCIIAHYDGYPFPFPPYGTPEAEIYRFLKKSPTKPPKEGQNEAQLVNCIRIKTFQHFAIANTPDGPVQWDPLAQPYAEFKAQYGPDILATIGFDYVPAYHYAHAWFTWQLAHPPLRDA
ncbi:MAG TPA: hypothetical protein ENK05_09575 [Gammaproteobacteria bacterium]|nr:hypothetical protein [Gammaproteobacteria bacterium]